MVIEGHIANMYSNIWHGQSDAYVNDHKNINMYHICTLRQCTLHALMHGSRECDSAIEQYIQTVLRFWPRDAMAVRN